MLDLDHFKQFNDAFGHDAGDTLLREVGTVLQRSIRGEDIACRYGGEEFTLILPEASLLDAAQRAEQHPRGHPRPQRRSTAASSSAPVTVSLGVAIYPDHGPTGDAVIRAADAALYQAKALGRDRVAVNPGGHGGHQQHRRSDRGVKHGSAAWALGFSSPVSGSGSGTSGDRHVQRILSLKHPLLLPMVREPDV